MKLGIFGGTFNPPHNTHLRIVTEARKQLCLDRVLVIPCGDPPHKKCSVDKNERLEMARAAFCDIAEIWDYEINKDGKSYTAETLKEVKRVYPDAEIFLIIGGDSFVDFDKWYCPEQIAEMCTLVVADRYGETIREAEERLAKRYGIKALFLNFSPDSMSSTEIRLRYRFGENVDCVPGKVSEYINRNGLYSEYRDMAIKLKEYLTPERYSHTFYVVKRGLELANDTEWDKVYIACLLHDVAKYIKPCEYVKYGFTPDKDMPGSVMHSFLGAEVAKRDFGIQDREILDAIAYHTTGRPNMTRLDKIVYIADKTEETRPYPVKHLLKGTVDETFVACLEKTYQFALERHHDSMCSLSEQTVSFYCTNNVDKA